MSFYENGLQCWVKRSVESMVGFMEILPRYLTLEMLTLINLPKEVRSVNFSCTTHKI